MAPRKARIIERPENPRREKIIAKQKKQATGEQHIQWWKIDGDDKKADKARGAAIFSALEYLDQAQGLRSLMNRYFTAMFYNRPPVSYRSAATAMSMGLPEDRLLVNAVKALINTKKSRIAKHNVRTRFMTNNANWETRVRAEGLEKFCAGQDAECDTHGQQKRQFLDGNICGTGAVKVYADLEDKKVVTDWVDIDRIVVDEECVIGGKVFELFDRVWMARDHVLAEYGEELGEEAIEKAAQQQGQQGSPLAKSDRICVVEAWHLPMKSDKSDGRHVIAIDGASYAEDWKRDATPFVFFRSETRREGFYGEGACERHNAKTTEMNSLVRTAHLGVKLGSVHRYHVHEKSEILDVEINNEVGAIVHWDGQIPVTKEVSNSVPPEVWQQIDWLYQLHFREEGVNEMSSSGKTDPGVTAAVAMREKNDMETDRLSTESQDYEWARVQINELQIEAARELSGKLSGGYRVKFRNDEGFEELDFKEVDMPRDQYVMAPYPSSSLPQTPTHRAQWIEERTKSGIITVEVGRKLMKMPDIDAEMEMLTAPEKDIDRTLYHMLRAKPDEDGHPVYLTPEPFQNLELARDRASRMYLRLRLVKGVPPERLELLQRFANQAHQMTMAKKAQEAAAMAPQTMPAGAVPAGAIPAGPPAGPPGAVPGVPPV